jgi:alpha-1,2-glucosyltransferase
LTAGNIWLFSPLFFFSGLYYTDVQSAFWTLVAYRLYLRYERRQFSSWGDTLWQVVFGVVALVFRQTNIFWVAVFPAGLALASEATRLSTRTPGAFGGVRKRDPLSVIAESWNKLRFYDMPVYEAGIEGMLNCDYDMILNIC